MKMDIVAGSQNDEFYTPQYAIEPILKYIPKDSRIWCPFDTDNSNFVKMLRAKGCKVFASHISLGYDFFKFIPEMSIDYIISNPPYSKRTEVLERLFELDIPFAMLLGVVGIFESQKRFQMFKKHDFEIMYLNKRISFFKDMQEQKPSINPPFSSVYICKGVLPKQIVFEEISQLSIPPQAKASGILGVIL